MAVRARSRHRGWRWGVIVAAFVALVVLAAACGDDDDESGDSAPAAEATTSAPAATPASEPESTAEVPATSEGAGEAEPATSVAEITSEPVELTIWDWGAPPPESMKELDDAYMAFRPNVTIKRVNQPFDSYFAQLRSAIAARKGPDIFTTYATPFAFDHLRGMQPLGELVRPEERENLIGWPYVSANLSDDGQPYALPWSGQGINFYYNKRLFSEAGLDPEAPPQTWDDLLAACDALKAANIVPIASGWKDGYYAEWWLEVLSTQYQTDEELAEQVDVKWETDAQIKAWNLLLDLKERGCLTPNDEGIALFPDVVNNFGAEKAAIFLGLSSNSINWSEFASTKVGPNLGAFLQPLVPDSLWDGPRQQYGGALAYAIARWTEHADVAYDYLAFISSAESQEKTFTSSGTFPNNRTAKPTTDDPVGQQILGWFGQYPTYIGQANLIRANVQIVFDKVALEIMAGRMSVEDAMKQLDEAQAKAPPIPEE